MRSLLGSRSLQHRDRRQGASRGFTLVEVLCALAIVALAVFPMLLLVERAEKDSFDAKFATLCSGRMRSLLAELQRTAKPGSSGAGDFSSMTEEEGFDERFAFADIRYEWQCQSMDLSVDVAPKADESDAEKKERQSRDEKKRQKDEEEEADAAIDARFRVRYFKVVCTYKLEDGEERELIVETYAPPLPTDEELKKENGRDVVPPNGGTKS
ncbi:MAG: prepilin-type N-terminal cleavage/methylation domain-containing protein [Planctomycetes bacterium]|nr:prepilin-type N-terminal cleavage/methylation domain-containing protein [Planctomycetota bacterium]